MPLEFTEYTYPRAVYGQMPDMPPGQEVETQVVAIAVGSTQSEAFNARTRMIVVSKVDADCRIAVGENPVADAAEQGMNRFLKAGNEYRFAVEPGHKLATIAV